jgi:Cys/Met metabolism PLP-dependent enzyme
MGAISALMRTLLAAGDHVIIDRVLYGNSFVFFTKGLTRFGVKVTVADFTRPQTVADAIRKESRLFYFETPANPNLRVIDIAEVASLARSADVLQSWTALSLPGRGGRLKAEGTSRETQCPFRSASWRHPSLKGHTGRFLMVGRQPG